ncbi:unnamed protein product [Rotaria socialis]|uniref:Uncharacterized protein n=1 Tax=Rotaria socialis TaxID=392032 RepID=A0A820N096_9BILA|nr:unnamed protein product [Rotaria socialis]CAF3608279.1 unnamed protein product [Rotaria socialis]CAF4381472.1 unnamed protein product [Rotaria socialis]CAF4509266.1 unnamed protein product [Rotaria socialis]
MDKCTRECLRIPETIEYSQENLAIINKALENESNPNEQVKMRIHRAKLLFDKKDWSLVLDDIKFIEENKQMNDLLYMIKWKSLLHNNIGQVRREIISKLHDEVISSNEHLNLLTCTTEDKIDDFINGKYDDHGKQSATSNKRFKK